MSSDASVIAAIEVAAAAPGNVALRIHLAQLLVDAGRADDALGHARAALGHDPVNLEALGIAALAAGLTGEGQAASGYERLLWSLQPTKTTTAVPAPTPAVKQPSIDAPTDSDAEADDTYDTDIERPNVTLADVAGMTAVKERLELAFLGPMRNEELRRAFGATMRGGLLLYGPPGCVRRSWRRPSPVSSVRRSSRSGGPTSSTCGSARPSATSTTSSTPPAVPRRACCSSTRSTPSARSAATCATRPACAAATTACSSSAPPTTRGTSTPRSAGPAASTAPSSCSRPTSPPASPSSPHCTDRPVATDLDLASIATQTDGYSGADLAHLCDSASQFALAASLKAGTVRPIGNHDLRAALKEVRSSTGPWFDTADNYATFANTSGEYDDLLAYNSDRRKKGRRSRG